MGLTKQYLAYRAIDSFNIISSNRTNAVNFLTYNSVEGRYVLAAAAENAIIWDLRLGERALTLRREKQEVTALRASPDRVHVAVGYADGFVEIYDITQQQEQAEYAIFTLALHKSAISVLRYEESGIRLVTGGLDTELVVVDMLEQAGKQRLIGHNGSITDAHFLQRFDLDNVIVSASKDMQIKFWNLETQFCFKTIVDNRTEIWGLALVGNLLVAGCSESGMNVYRLSGRDTSNANSNILASVEGLSIDNTDTQSPLNVSNCGTIQRAGKGRTVSLVADSTERIISCHGTNGLIENFYICTPEEVKQRVQKRLKKAKKVTDINDDSMLSNEVNLIDEIKRLESIKIKEKIKSIDVLLGANNELRVLVSLSNNSLQLHSLEATLNHAKSKKDIDEPATRSVKLLRSLTRAGHQSEVRAVCFTSDSLALGSGAGESFKLWNRESMQCLRTMPTGYVLCCTFAPGDRYVLLGLKSGKLLIADVGSSEIIEEVSAHDSELWCMALLPDLQGCVTGGSDCTAKIWNFELVDNSASMTNNEENLQAKVLSLLHKSTLKLEETVLCLGVSPDSKYLAVGLLDATVKIFFLDSFKFFLSLYGHKLPVLCLDISYDARLIVTGSADRNIKIWGLDFGDCHRSLFAHDDSVMAVKFIPKTHMFFSCGKDGKIKHWDADNFEKIITLPGHIGEAYNLAVSPNGKYLVSCGSDRTLRLFERTDEPIVLEDVQEEEREEIANQQLATGDESAVPLLPGLKLASRKTVGSERAAESILECLEICKQYDMGLKAGEKSDLHPMMRALSVDNTCDFLLTTIARIRASDLEEALLILPFSNVIVFLEHLPQLYEKRSDEIELLAKVTIFLFKVHMKAITGIRSLKSLLESLVHALKIDVRALRNIMGYNLHGLLLLQHDVEEREGVEIFRDATQQRRKREKKRRAATKRVFIQMS